MKTKSLLIGVGLGLLPYVSSADLPRGVYGFGEIEEARSEAKEKGKALVYLMMDSVRVLHWKLLCVISPKAGQCHNRGGRGATLHCQASTDSTGISRQNLPEITPFN